MFAVIYVEEAVAEHPRAREIRARFPDATVVRCERYGEVFNPKAQSFRLQKRRPALILARKHDGHVLAVPPGYGIGGEHNFYFSHMLNCVYDCRYCFLQGMHRSAHQVLFVNYEDFASAIKATVEGCTDGSVWMFSGYDCDSLAMEPVSGFARHFLELFAGDKRGFLELRTKSTQIRTLLERSPMSNVIVAFSLTPDSISRALEHKVPSLDKRIDAMVRLQGAGWPLGLRFDPLIYTDTYRDRYEGLFTQVFERLDPDSIHSVTLGPFRLPRQYFKTMVRQYPDEPLFAGRLVRVDGMVSYPRDVERQMLDFCHSRLEEYLPADKLFSHAVNLDPPQHSR